MNSLQNEIYIEFHFVSIDCITFVTDISVILNLGVFVIFVLNENMRAIYLHL